VWNSVNNSKYRIDLAMKAMLAEHDLSAWPRGITGQSCDCSVISDGKAISGKQDIPVLPPLVSASSTELEGVTEATA
jgi:hypothetical protein